MSDNRTCISIKNRGLARVDSIIKSRFPHLSRTEIDLICQNGFVKKDNHVLKKGQSVVGNIDIYLTKEQRHGLLCRSKGYRLNIAYEDEHILFISKDSGMPTVANLFLDTSTLANYVAGYMNTVSVGGVLNAGSINRLDNETSGLVLFAKTDLAFEYLYDIYHQNDNSNVEKYYIAFVEDEDKTFPNYIHLKNKMFNATSEKMAVLDNLLNKYNNKTVIKEASCEANLLGYSNKYAILLIKLNTGLRHQIRLQLATLGYPIIGDVLYGENVEQSRLMLHSYCTIIRPPISKNKIVVSSDFSFML